MGNLFRLVLSAGNVIKEKQRSCSAADDVVDAHCNAVDSDGAVPVREEGELELCSDSVRSGNEDGVLHSLCVKLKKAAEAAHVGADAPGGGSCNMAFHKLDRFVAGGYVNTGGGIRL